MTPAAPRRTAHRSNSSRHHRRGGEIPAATVLYVEDFTGPTSVPVDRSPLAMQTTTASPKDYDFMQASHVTSARLRVTMQQSVPMPQGLQTVAHHILLPEVEAVEAAEGMEAPAEEVDHQDPHGIHHPDQLRTAIRQRL